MDAQHTDIPANFGSNGPSGSGLICYSFDETTPTILQLETRPRSRGHGCLHAGLVNIQGVCQPSVVPNTMMSDQDQDTISTASPGNTPVENTAVVPDNSGTPGGLPKEDSPAARPGFSTTRSRLSNAARSPSANRLAHLRESYSSRGFSHQASDLMLAS